MSVGLSCGHLSVGVCGKCATPTLDQLRAQRDEAIKRLGDTLAQLWATEKERDEARAQALADLHPLQNAHEALADAVEAQSAALCERDEARADLQRVLTVCRQLWFMYGSREDITHKIAWRKFKEMLAVRPPLVTEVER
jgi:chromosome segregation ATPase